MKLRFAIVCDNAFTDALGKLNIIQTYDIIQANKFPALHPRLTIVTNYEFEKGERREQEYSQTLSIVEEKTGTELISGTIKANPKLEGGKYVQFINNILAIQFKNEGVYSVNFELNRQSFEKAASFVVKKMTN